MHNNFEYINTDYLYQVSKNPDFLKKIISLFKKEVQGYKDNMLQLLKEKAYDELAELVHKAKSGISVMGMTKQAEEMKIIEKDIHNSENYDTLEIRINQFLSDCEKALSEIIVIENTL